MRSVFLFIKDKTRPESGLLCPSDPYVDSAIIIPMYHVENRRYPSLNESADEINLGNPREMYRMRYYCLKDLYLVYYVNLCCQGIDKKICHFQCIDKYVKYINTLEVGNAGGLPKDELTEPDLERSSTPHSRPSGQISCGVLESRAIARIGHPFDDLGARTTPDELACCRHASHAGHERVELGGHVFNGGQICGMSLDHDGAPPEANTQLVVHRRVLKWVDTRKRIFFHCPPIYGCI
jgi:hypothetical protein